MTRELKSYVCIHVFDQTRPVLYVTRPDGDWCFLCGGDDHSEDGASYRVIGLNHALNTDPALQAVLGLRPDHEVERQAVDQPWSQASPIG